MLTTVQLTEKTRDKLKKFCSETDLSYDEAIALLVGPPKDTAKRLKNGYSAIGLPEKLAERIREKLPETGFDSVSEYAAFVLRLAVADPEGEKKVVERLKRLGYA